MGVIGRQGAGKSTLLSCLMGEESKVKKKGSILQSEVSVMPDIALLQGDAPHNWN